jgi:UDP-N-acetylmuramoylalanine--D-glutamate ligase
MHTPTTPLNVLVLGAGVSGLAMARWCVRMGAQVMVADNRSDVQRLSELQTQWPHLNFVQQDFDDDLMGLQRWNAVYRSPGLAPAQLAAVRQWCETHKVVYGNEVDLFVQGLLDHEPGPITETTGPETQSLDAEEAAVATVATLNAAVDAHSGDGEATSKAYPDVVGSADKLNGSTDVAIIDGVDADMAVEQAVANDNEEPHALAAPAVQPVVTSRAPKVLAVTGTNGKTTVCALTAMLLQRAGIDAIAAGNISPSLLDALSNCLDNNRWPQVWVLELSSFQLDACTSLQPYAATIVNISQDHLDWHGNMSDYIAAKGQVFGAMGLRLLNRDDAAVMQFIPQPAPQPKRGEASIAHPSWASFGTDAPTRVGDWGLDSTNGLTWLVRALPVDDHIQAPKRGQLAKPVDVYMQRLMPADALRIRGQHNATNALVALALATSTGADLAAMLYGLREYTGEPHRMQSVAVVHDVEYVNDSKGTNVGATLAAISGLGRERRLVLILGGDGKGQDFNPLCAAVAHYVRAVVLIGRDAPAIRLAIAPAGVAMHEVQSMQLAVQLCQELAQIGDAVLLSPACASFDMFNNYSHRAEVFTDAVAALSADVGVDLL